MNRFGHVGWYLISLGNGFNFHTPHWHINVVTVKGLRTDVILLSPAQLITTDMVPDNPGERTPVGGYDRTVPSVTMNQQSRG